MVQQLAKVREGSQMGIKRKWATTNLHGLRNRRIADNSLRIYAPMRYNEVGQRTISKEV